MRLERLDLAPYGRFDNHSLTFSPDTALHVVLGANEAGKTTTLEAIGDFLFGVRDRTAYAFAHDFRALRIGGAVRFADGARLEARRRKGDKNTLVDADDRPLADERLRQALAGIDRRTFEAEFGLSQRTLREGGEALLRAGGSLAEALAAGSASLGALSALRARLAAEAEALFGPRKSKKPFYDALDAYSGAERRLREATVTADALRTAEAAASRAEAEAIDLKARHQEQGRAIARARRALRVGPKLARLDALGAEGAAFADLPDVSAQTLASAREALEAARGKRAEAERLAAEEAEDAALRAALGLDPALLAQGEAIDALRERLGEVRKDEKDLPARLGAQAQARQQLEALARRLGRDDHTALLEGAPSDATLARLRALCARSRANAEAREAAERRHAAALAELRAADAGDAATLADPAPLKRRLDTFADVARDAERLRQERAAITEEAQALAEAAARLDPPAADLAALARLALPERAALEARARVEATAADALRKARDAAEAALGAAQEADGDLARLEAEAPGATRADWEAARAARDAALDRLGAALSGPDALRAERFEAARAFARAADATAENLLADADRAARRQAAREAAAARRRLAETAEQTRAAAAAAHAKACADSAALWASSGIAPRDLAAMTLWRERAEALLDRRARLGERRAAATALAERVAAAHDALRAWFEDSGAAAPSGDAFEETLRAARIRLDALAESRRAAAEREARRRQAERALAEWAGDRDKAEAEAKALAQGWGEATAALGLRADASVEEAEAALNAWGEVALPRREFEDVGHRIDTMTRDIAQFERAVAEVVLAGAPAEAGAPAREVLPRLVAALEAARKAEDERLRLEAAAARRAARRAHLEAERAALAQTLALARTALGVADDEALARALERCDARARQLAEEQRLRAELHESGDGLTEAALREEAAGFDLAALPAEIEQSEQAQTALLNAISQAGAAAAEAARARDALEQGRNAAEAARDRVEAGGELVEIAERWIERAAAAALARRAIERHRAQAQDPLIARAGELFRLATAGHFAGLGVGFDEADQPVLAARRASGAAVEVKGLSEGARDQLFLSLRLALLERRAGEPLPFIGDDLLASFDDERARHALDLLASLGEGRQTILFTHHARIAELARGFGRKVEVLEM